MDRLLIPLALFLTNVRSQCNRVDWNGNPVAADVCFYYRPEQRYLKFDCATTQLRHFGIADPTCSRNSTLQTASNAKWHCNYNKTCGFVEITNCHAVGGIQNASQVWEAQPLDYCNTYNSGNATNGSVVTLSSDIYECCQDQRTIRHTFFTVSDKCKGTNFSVELSASCQVPKNSNSKIEIRAFEPKCDPAKLVKCLGVTLAPTRYPTSTPVGNSSTTIIPSNSSTSMAPNSNTTMNPNGTTSTMAPGNGTTIAPGNGTTIAPGNGTTVAPGNGTTTMNPNATTTAAASGGGGGSKNNGPSVVLIVFLVIAGVLVLLFCIAFIVWRRRQNSGVTVSWDAYGAGGDTGYAPLQQDGTGGGSHQEDVQ